MYYIQSNRFLILKRYRKQFQNTIYLFIFIINSSKAFNKKKQYNNWFRVQYVQL